MEFKPGVSLKGMTPQILLGLIEAEKIYKNRLLTMTVLGMHTTAVELQTKGTGSARSLLGDLKRKLLPAGYEVLLMEEGLDLEHIRVVHF